MESFPEISRLVVSARLSVADTSTSKVEAKDPASNDVVNFGLDS